MWKYLTHPNILPLLGVTLTPFQLISSWMPGGNLSTYIKKNPDADRIGLVRAPPVVLAPRLLPLPAIRCRQWPLLPPLPQCDSWGPEGSTWSSQFWFCCHIDTRPAKYPHGQLQQCTHRRFRPRCSHSEPGFHTKCPIPPWLHSTVDCARALEQRDI